MDLEDRRYVVSIDKAIYKVSRDGGMWEVVPLRGEGLFRRADANIPLTPIPAGITDASTSTGTSSPTTPSQIPNNPPEEADYEDKLRFLHSFMVASLNGPFADNSLKHILAGPFRWTRRVYIEKSAVHTITEDGHTSFWRQVSTESSWRRRALQKISGKGRGTEDGGER
jgi:hypothetical protein